MRNLFRFSIPVRGSRREIAIFTRQLAVLIRAGVPLVKALDILARQADRAPFRRLISRLSGSILAGGSLSDALRGHPKTFGSLYVNLVAAGEASGALGPVLERLAQFQEKSGRIAAKVKSAMIYPFVVMIVSAAIVSGLLIFVVPRFQDIFQGQLKGQPLPALTRHVIVVGVWIKDHGLAAAGAVPAALLLGARIRSSRVGRKIADGLLLRLPLTGDLVRKTAAAGFARTFGALLTGGVPMLQALSIAAKTAGNVRVADALENVRRRVKEGDAVAPPLAATRMFPAMLTSMIEVGEETGALPEMLSRVADTYEEEVDTAIAGLMTLIEPAMIVIMAVVVGTIVIALFLPIIRIIQLMS